LTRIGTAGGLIGRSSELATGGAFLDKARSGGAALLIFGEPGVGKTVLFDAAAEMALVAGTQVLRLSPRNGNPYRSHPLGYGFRERATTVR
jgi:hypothetical protein